jgi:hypothetical protein
MLEEVQNRVHVLRRPLNIQVRQDVLLQSRVRETLTNIGDCLVFKFVQKLDEMGDPIFSLETRKLESRVKSCDNSRKSGYASRYRGDRVPAVPMNQAVEHRAILLAITGYDSARMVKSPRFGSPKIKIDTIRNTFSDRRAREDRSEVGKTTPNEEKLQKRIGVSNPRN